jgi:hypothetical protein
VIDYTDPQLLWWEESDPRRAGAQMVAVADRLYMAGVSRRERNLRHAKLFANQDLSSIYDCGVANYNGAGVYLSVNVTESCVNTLAAKLTRTRIRPVLLTDKASRTLQKQAEAGTDAMDGIFQANELHEAEGQQMFVDGALFGNGWAYGEYDQDDEREIVIDRVLPDEMLFDETEAMYGMRNLYTLYRRKYIHRQALYRMRDEEGKLFGDDPEKRDAIKRAPAVQNVGSVWADQGGQMVPVTFGWRLPSRKGAGDGRVLMAIGGASTADGMLITGSGIGDGTTLLGQEWKRAKFPLCQFTYQRRPIGLYGRSLAEQLVPIQLKINEQLEVIDEGQRLLAVARVFYNNGAINTDQFDNEVARFIELAVGHTIEEVKIDPGHGAAPEMYQDLETWIRRAYEITGISMLSATAEKPEGITSAVALRELLDREDLRFSDLGKRWERFNRDIGAMVLDIAAETVESGRKLSITVPGDRSAKQIDFGELKLQREKMVVDVSAASSLPTTPAARKQYAQDLLDRQIISVDRYLEIIDEAGDVKQATSLVTAVQESIDLDVDDILDNAKWRAPEKMRDPALARDTAIARYAQAVHQGVPEKNLEMLRRYIILATRMAGPPPAPAGLPMPLPGGAGAPLPNLAPPIQQAAAAGAPGAGPPAPSGPMPQDLAAAAPQPAPPVAPMA